ncbi:MAG: TnpV protein, partial [Dysosmobacter sp.]|nr:TnpV protein [Dysosmobacter sp.]
MEKSFFEQIGGTYRQERDYSLPNLTVPESVSAGIWGQCRRQYLREHRKALYNALLLSGELDSYRDVDLSEDSRMPLGDWLDRWLEEYVLPAVRESTLKGYRQYIECYIKPRLGDKQVCKVTAADMQALYREVQENGRKTEHPEYGYALSGSTIRSLHGVFHQAMDAAVQERLTARNPTEDVTLPKKKSAAKQILNDEQLERFMEEIKKDPVWHDFFYTELTTGMRRGEICGLMWSDFDGKKGTLTVRRT